MNFLRGILSIGIIIGCLLTWVDIETEVGFFALSGLTWVPVTILLYASVLTTGYAFYSSYNSTNRNTWIYLTSGLYGIGICIYIYLALLGHVDLLYTLDPNLANLMEFYFDLGLYVTALFSALLFLTGFDKSDSKEQVTQQTFDQQYNSMRRTNYTQSDNPENSDRPSLQGWLKENQGKSINDYFSKYK